MSSTANLSRSNAMWIRGHGKELSAIPASDVVWEWDETELSHQYLCALMHRNLITQVDGGWMTDERLYARLEEEGWLEDDETIEASEVLEAPDGGG